jgi:hypothetical protein
MPVKKYIYFYLFICAIVLSLTSCSSQTNLFSWKDSTYSGGYINNILVMAIVKDLEFRNAYEESVSKILNEKGIKSVKSLSILSPAKKYTQEDFDTILTANNLDAILFVNYQGTEIEKIDSKGNTYYKFYKNVLRTTSRKGYYEIHRTVLVETSLFSASSEKIIWLATAKTIDAYDVEDLANSLAKEIIKNLSDNRLIIPVKIN